MYQWDKIKVIGNYDTVVVGGGTAGAAAGIRAAKEGNRVLIVEKSLALGGAAVNALVNPMMESFVEHGEIFHEIERRLKEKGVTTRDGIMEYVHSTAEAKALVLEEMFLEYGGEILYDAVLTDCQVKDQKIEKIFVTTEEGVYAIEAEQFVDATGDAVLSRMAGVAYTAERGLYMNIIVTGGAGFIGSNFIFHMLKKYPDYRIICLDCLTYAGNLSTLAPVMDNPNFRFVKKSITDREAVYKLFEEEHPDMVVNFAAESHVDRSIENPEVFLDTNIKGTAVLMDACRKYGIKRYHQVSTDEVYGDLPLDRPDLFFTEETPIHTSSPYSSSKAGADLLVLAYHRTYGLPVTISRCSNNYGPYHFPEKLIPLMIANALNDKPLPVYGEGLNVRDWLYVEDHCKAIDLIIHKGRVGEIYNVGGHNEKRNIDIVKLICKELGKPESLIVHVGDRKGHDMRYAIDPSKIHNELGWLPETKFEDGIKKTIQWYLDNKEWWETIISGEYQNYYEKMYSNR